MHLFFKAADYGIVGDAFDVIPKLISEIKKFKSDN
jgi:electron transfer flavoprotein alpha subunit